MKATPLLVASAFGVCCARAWGRHFAVAWLAVARRGIDMYPFLPAESLTSVVQIGLALVSLLVAMFSFLMTRSA